MTVMVLNTHEAIKRLVKAGQEEGAAEAIVALITDMHEQVATKSDLKHHLEVMEHRITVRLYTVGIAVVGMLAALKYWG